MKCRFCNKNITPKPEPKMPEQFDCKAHALTFIVGSSIFSDVCDNKNCQDHANYEAEQFDMMRKEW